MPTDDESQQDDTDSNTGDKPHDLRKQLEAANKLNQELTSKVTNLQAASLMPTLNERQRRVVMRELTEDKLELSEDNVKAVAEDLGYNLTPAPPTNPPVDSQNGQQQQSQQQDSDQDEEVMVSLKDMNAMDRANWAVRKGNVSPTLEAKMKAAKSVEELRNVIRSEGPSSGILHEWDDE